MSQVHRRMRRRKCNLCFLIILFDCLLDAFQSRRCHRSTPDEDSSVAACWFSTASCDMGSTRVFSATVDTVNWYFIHIRRWIARFSSSITSPLKRLRLLLSSVCVVFCSAGRPICRGNALVVLLYRIRAIRQSCMCRYGRTVYATNLFLRIIQNCTRMAENPEPRTKCRRPLHVGSGDQRPDTFWKSRFNSMHFRAFCRGSSILAI